AYRETTRSARGGEFRRLRRGAGWYRREAAWHAADRARTEPRARPDQPRARAVRAARAARVPADVQGARGRTGRQSGAYRNLRDRTPCATLRPAQWRIAPARARRQPGSARAQ